MIALSNQAADERRHNFFIVDNEVIMQHAAEIGAHGVAVYCALVCHAGNKGRWDGSMSYLAKELGMSRRGVLNVLEKLEEKGLIGVERRRVGNNMKATNVYKILQVKKVSADVHEVHNDVNEPDVNDVHINNTYLEQDVKKELPNGSSKEGKPSSPRRIKKLSDEEAQERWNTLCEEDPNGEALRTFAEILAEENATGEVAITRVWREIGQRYLNSQERHELGDGAWAHGFSTAIAKGAPNIGYVVKVAKNYRPSSDKKPAMQTSGGEYRGGKQEPKKTRKDYSWWLRKDTA